MNIVGSSNRGILRSFVFMNIVGSSFIFDMSCPEISPQVIKSLKCPRDGSKVKSIACRSGIGSIANRGLGRSRPFNLPNTISSIAGVAFEVGRQPRR